MKLNPQFEKALDQCRNAQVGESIKIPLHDGSHAIWTINGDGHASVTFSKAYWDAFIREENILPRNMSFSADPRKCSFGIGCSCPPQDCPERFESWIREQDRIEEKLYKNLLPVQRNLSCLLGVKARLAQRCNNHHGKPKPLSEEEARAVVSVKRRIQKPEMPRDERRKIVAIVAAQKEAEGRTEQIKREIQERKPEPPIEPKEESERETTTGGLFEKVEEEPEVVPPHLERFKRRY